MKSRFLVSILFSLLLASSFTSCKSEFDDTQTAGDDYLNANAKSDSVHVLASGLQYKVIYDNPYGILPRLTGKNPAMKVNYTASFIDGTVIESPENATLYYNNVIPGVQETFRRMKIGSKWKIWIPQDLGYGADGAKDGTGAYTVDPYTTLIYEIELLGEY